MVNSEPDTSGRNTPEPLQNRAATFHNGFTSEGGMPENAQGARRNVELWKKGGKQTGIAPSTYAYKEIDYDHEIRVLKLYAGKPGSRLDCRLVPCPLLHNDRVHPSVKSTEIKYTALSYCWGNDTARHKVYLFENDAAREEHSRKFKKLSVQTQNAVTQQFGSMYGYMYIQENLSRSLHHLRDTERDVYIWSDALCIHQANRKERSIQVSHMHEIYTQASRVCVWLGDAAGKETQNRETFRFLRDILDLQQLERYIGKLPNKESRELKACLGVVDLMKEDWFKRRWIIQELALASNAYVQRGTQYMPWSEFADAISLFMTKRDHILRAFHGFGSYEDSLNRDHNQMKAFDDKALGANTLVTATNNLFRRSKNGKIQQRLLSLELLVSTMLLAFESSDPKDTIFAVLQLARDTYRTQTLNEIGQPLFGITMSTRLSLIGISIALIISFLFRSLTSSVVVLDAPSLTNTSIFVAEVLINILIFCLCSWLAWLVIRWVVTKLNAVISWRRKDSMLEQQVWVLDRRIEPDYEKETVDVYCGFLEYCVEKSNSLNILCRHWAPCEEDGRKMNMPSWILPIEGDEYGGPRRRIKTHGVSLVSGPDGRACYSASGLLEPVYKFMKNEPEHEVQVKPVKQISGAYAEKPPLHPKTRAAVFNGELRVRGIILGTIEREERIAGSTLSKHALGILGWDTSSDSKEAYIDQLWRILVANRGPGGTNPPNWYKVACEACMIWHKDQSNHDYFNTNILTMMDGTPTLKVDFLKRVQEVVWGRKCFNGVDRKGNPLVGLAPPDSQKGDILCVLFGCSVPVVLKRESSHYEFVGEAYVHGMMDGEAVEPMPERHQQHDFLLR